MDQTSDRAAIERVFASDEEAATSAPWAAALPGELQHALGIGKVETVPLQIAKAGEEILHVTPAGEWRWSERADELIAGMRDATMRMILQRLRAVEADAAGGEPIGEIEIYTGSIFDGAAAPFNRVVWKDGVQPPPGTKLYTNPAAPAAVPDGFKLVPVEPTPEMLRAEPPNGFETSWQRRPEVWAAMLSATPATATNKEPPAPAPVPPAHKLETITGFVQGYGGPSEHTLRIVYGNALLESKKFGDGYGMGRAAALLEQKWQAAIDDGSIEALAAEKPRAFLLCTSCGGLCRGMVSFIGDPYGKHGVDRHELCEKCSKTELPRIREERERRAKERGHG